MKFTPEQRAFIEETRNKINSLEIEQANLYRNLLDQLNMTEQSEEWMFDYVYNFYGSIEYIEGINQNP
jgi:hypothetical protein